jgi:hypothetical protein
MNLHGSKALARMLIAAACVGATGAVGAQDVAARLLRGIGAVDVVIESVGKEAERCGVRPANLESTLRAALQLSPIRQAFDAAAYLYLRGLFLASDTQCLYTLTLELRSAVSIDETGTQGIASIWRTGFIEATGIVQAPGKVRGAVEMLASELVSDWTQANE